MFIFLTVLTAIGTIFNAIHFANEGAYYYMWLSIIIGIIEFIVFLKLYKMEKQLAQQAEEIKDLKINKQNKSADELADIAEKNKTLVRAGNEEQAKAIAYEHSCGIGVCEICGKTFTVTGGHNANSLYCKKRTKKSLRGLLLEF